MKSAFAPALLSASLQCHKNSISHEYIAYIMFCLQDVGPLLYENPERVEKTKQIRPVQKDNDLQIALNT